MINRQEFTHFLWESLGAFDYVWLNAGENLQSEGTTPEVLISPKSVKALLPQMRQHPGISVCRASFRFSKTLAVFSFHNWSYTISFLHKMVNRNLFFLDEEEIKVVLSLLQD